MTQFTFSPARLPFNGQDGRSYYMNDEGQLVRVNFKEARSIEAWATLRPGQHHELPAESATDELQLALSRLVLEKEEIPASPLNVSIFGDQSLSAAVGSALSLAGLRCETVHDPRQADPHSSYLLVAAGYFHSRLFRQAEEAFGETNISWVPFYLEGKQARLGPCMGPYLTLKDLTTRLLSASVSPDILQDLWRHAETVRFPGLPFSLPEQQWLCATMALLLEDWHKGEPRGFSPERHQLTIRPATREVIHHPVLRLPSSTVVGRSHCS